MNWAPSSHQRKGALLRVESVLSRTPQIRNGRQYLVQGRYDLDGYDGGFVSLSVGANPFRERHLVDVDPPTGTFYFMRTRSDDNNFVLELYATEGIPERQDLPGRLDLALLFVGFPEDSLVGR